MKTKIGRVKPYFMSDISLEKAFSFRWADLSLKGVIKNLFNEEISIGAFAPDAPAELRDFPRHPP